MITMIVTKMIMTVTLKGMEGCGGGNLGGMGDHNLSELLLCLYLSPSKMVHSWFWNGV